MGRVSSSAHERDLRWQWCYNDPGRQWGTFSSSSGTEDFVAGKELITGTDVQIQVLEVTTQNMEKGQLCLYCMVTCTKEQKNEFQVCS